MPEKSHQRVVVITGAAAGVGRAAALRFAQAGARLGLIARDETALRALADEIKAVGGEPEIAAADVSDAVALLAAAEHFENVLGPIDLWINDAMLTVFSPVQSMAPEEFRRVTEVTYLGVVHGCMAALKYMLPRRHGHIINVGSALAYRGIPLQSAYCGAKHAIRGFTAALRAEMKHGNAGIDISIVELPAMNTPQFSWARTHMDRQPKPMGTIYQPEAAAAALYRAAQSRPREYWVGLSTVLTVIGNMILPDFMDWYLARGAVKGQQTRQPVSASRPDNLFEPITALHATRGAFNAGAKKAAAIVSGTAMRIFVVAAGAIVFFALGGIIF